MILPSQPSLIKTTGRTSSGREIHIDDLWLNSGNKKKHGPGFDLPFFLEPNGGNPTVSNSHSARVHNGDLPIHLQTKELSKAITRTGEKIKHKTHPSPDIAYL